MSLKKEIYKIIERLDGTGKVDECVKEIGELFINDDNITNFEIFTDEDVFDSCGIDVFYIGVAWVDINNKLHICGSRLTSR